MLASILFSSAPNPARFNLPAVTVSMAVKQAKHFVTQLPAQSPGNREYLHQQGNLSKKTTVGIRNLQEPKIEKELPQDSQ